MKIEKLLQSTPLLQKNDTIARIRNLMNRYRLPELPVMDENKVIGVVRSKDIFPLLRRKINLETLLAHHIISNEFLKVGRDTSLKEIIRRVTEKNLYTVCVFENDSFIGYIPRRNLLQLLFKKKGSIREFLSTNFVKIREDESIKKVIKKLEKGLPFAIFKGKEIVSAFSEEDLSLECFVSGYLAKKISGLETLKGEEKKSLRLKISEQEIREMKEKGIRYTFPFSISLLLKKPIVVREESEIGEVARLMFENSKSVLAVKPFGVIRDLDLLRVIV